MAKKVAKRKTASKKASEWFDPDAERLDAKERSRAARLALLECENPLQWLVEGGRSTVPLDRVWDVRQRVLPDIAKVLIAFGESFEELGTLIQAWVEADAQKNEARFEAIDRVLMAIAWRSRSLRCRLLPGARVPIDPKDYSAIRRALEVADGEPDAESRARAFLLIQLHLDINTRSTRFLRVLKDAHADLVDEFSASRYSDSNPDGAANRQRKGLRVLLEQLHGYSPDESARTLKAVFDAPTKKQRRTSKRARTARTPAPQSKLRE